MSAPDAIRFFEEAATMGNPAPLALAQQIRESERIHEKTKDALKALVQAVFFPNDPQSSTLAEAAIKAKEALDG